MSSTLLSPGQRPAIVLTHNAASGEPIFAVAAVATFSFTDKTASDFVSEPLTFNPGEVMLGLVDIPTAISDWVSVMYTDKGLDRNGPAKVDVRVNHPQFGSTIHVFALERNPSVAGGFFTVCEATGVIQTED
jgi:hypothetical protein